MLESNLQAPANAIFVTKLISVIDPNLAEVWEELKKELQGKELAATEKSSELL